MLFEYLARFADILFTVLTYAIIGRALLSWFNIGPGHPIGRILFEITEPILGPVRRVVPMIGMLDISPIVALLLLWFLQGTLVPAIMAGA